MVTDLDLVKRICIKDFWHFSDSGLWPEAVEQAEYNQAGIISKLGKEWKAVRSATSPAFSIANLKDVAQKVGL